MNFVHERDKSFEIDVEEDNAACEGLFKPLKTEIFYNKKWFAVSIAEFMDILNRYLHWYNEQRNKMALGAMSPLEYPRSLNMAA
jgi:transposase InsO family protein